MRCQSRILKEYKPARADCMWPECTYGPVDVGTLPECGGNVTVKVRCVNEPEWGGTSARMEIQATCTKCMHPWWPGRIAWEAEVLNWDGWDVTSILERWNELGTTPNG